ncbi:MAG TPA: O-antigen ligase family protein [Flavobacteriaceae bacterium]|nr:O-antigen ligase family protein [Flavobacteriaceae bacterium]
MFPNTKQTTDPFAAMLFLLLFAVLPFLDILSPIVLALVLFAGLFLKNQSDLLEKIKTHKSLFLLMAYFVLSVLSLIYTSNLSESMEKCLKLTAFLLVPLAFLLVSPEKSLIDMAKRVFAFSCMLFCVFTLLTFGYHYLVNYEISHFYNFVQRFLPGEYFPEDALFFNTAFVIVLFGGFSKKWKLIAGILFFIVMVLYGVRLGLFIYLLILIVYTLANFKKLFNLKSLFIVGAATLFSFFLINQSPYLQDKFYGTLTMLGFDAQEEVSEIGMEYHHLGDRKKIWMSAVELIREKPVFGYGAGSEKEELNKIYLKKKYDLLQLNAHNQPLSTTIQYGIIGLLLLFFIFIVLLRFSILKKNWVNLMIIGVMLISMTTESFLEIQQGLLYFCIFASLFIMEYKAEPKSKNSIEN